MTLIVVFPGQFIAKLDHLTATPTLQSHDRGDTATIAVTRILSEHLDWINV